MRDCFAKFILSEAEGLATTGLGVWCCTVLLGPRSARLSARGGLSLVGGDKEGNSSQRVIFEFDLHAGRRIFGG
jgi:hypothetical protein